MPAPEPHASTSIRNLMLRALDRAFWWDKAEGSASTEMRSKWMRLRENCYKSIVATLSFLPVIGLTWLLLSTFIQEGQTYTALAYLVVAVAFTGYCVMAWGSFAIVRCTLFAISLQIKDSVGGK